jgi:hypothetical protein
MSHETIQLRTRADIAASDSRSDDVLTSVIARAALIGGGELWLTFQSSNTSRTA